MRGLLSAQITDVATLGMFALSIQINTIVRWPPEIRPFEDRSLFISPEL